MTNNQHGNWKSIFNNVQEPIILVTPEGIITDANDAAVKAARIDKEQIVNSGICQIIHGGRLPHIKCPLEEFLLTKSRKVMETKLPGLFGDYLLTISPVIDNDKIIRCIMLIFRDLTSEEIRRVENLRTAQLASIGELAAGVAHEVNNPINGIINYAQLLLDDNDRPENEELLNSIVTEGQRISTIIYELLSFARDGDNEMAPISLSDIISECLALVKHQYKNDGILLTTEFKDNLPFITGNAQQLKQVIFNLLSNSHYALKNRFEDQENQSKKIKIKCHPYEKDSVMYTKLTIKDNGAGIPQGLLDKLFDPFFTTKTPGEGTGLGLSISYGIIKDHSGFMKIDSVLHNYTSVSIYIPVIDNEKHIN